MALGKVLELLQEGIVVMIVGMGIVFAFLVVMVFAVEIMHKIIEYLNKIFPPENQVEVKKTTRATDEELIAVAIAASRI